MNWYAYKVLADSYDADRRRQAAHHRRAREAARLARSRREDESVRLGSGAVEHGRSTGWWSTIAARLRHRPTPTPSRPSAAAAAATPARPTTAVPPAGLRPSLPR